MSGKSTRILNSSLLAGSSDDFRNTFGGYYTDTETDNGQELVFTNGNTETPNDPVLDKIFFGLDNQLTSDYTNMVPSHTFPVRVVSNSTEVLNDKHWKAYIMGGTYTGISYNTKISLSSQEYRNLDYEMPYSKIEALGLEEYGASDIVQIGYDYTQHLPDYEANVSSFSSDLLLPNYNILADYYSKNSEDNIEEFAKVYPAEMLDWISLNGNYDTPQFLFSFNETKIPYDVPSYMKDSFTDLRKRNTNLIVNYLTSSTFTTPVSSSTEQWALSKQQTIFLDDSAIRNLGSLGEIYDCLPYKMKISFPTKTSGDFVSSYVESGFDDKLMTALNEAFVSQQTLQSNTSTLTRGQTYLSLSSGLAVETAAVESGDYRQVDYIEFLTYCRDQYINNNTNAMFVGERNMNRISAMDTTGVYRHINTIKSTGMLNRAINKLNSTDFAVTSHEDLFSGKQVFDETIAYRIEKISGPPAGDGLTQNTLQNYWYLNSEALNDLEFYDSQVRYNTDYTYRIYAYVLVGGFKYQYTDLRLSRNLGCSGSYAYGAEFYDPNTDQAVERLFSGSLGDFDDSAGGTYGTLAQISTNYKYLADFNITYEPSMKLVEIPIYTKTLRILDNPPNKINITPFQVTDDSQRIGFNFYYDSFTQNAYPSTISQADRDMRDLYLSGRDIADTTKITLGSTSRQANIEVYRLNNRPNSLEEFDTNRRVSLRFEQNTETYLDQINTNQKYYYLFRVLNQQGMPSMVSEIYEVELINDGGYKFALFNVILESELEQPPPKTNSKSCKKIFQLKPNISQISLNTENVDFSQSAASQLSNVTIGSAEDLIWDKTFKIRLTSKKTSKKIDLNITYKISSE